MAAIVLGACSSSPASDGAPTTTSPTVVTASETTVNPPPSTSTAPALDPPIRGLVEVWRGTHPDYLANPPPDRAGVIDDGTTIVVPGFRTLVAYDVATGAQLWTSPLVLSSIVRPVADRVVDGLVVAATAPRVLSALDARTGRAVWQTPIDATDCSAVGAPRVTGALVFVTIAEPCRQSVVAARVAAFDLRAGALAWERTLAGTRGNAVTAPLLATDDLVIVGAMVGDVEERTGRQDSYFAFDAVSGASRWTAQFDRHPDNSVVLTQPPSLHDGVVVVHELSQIGQARPSGIDAVSGQLRWQSEIGNDVLIGDVLIGLDLVRADTEQPLVPKALSVETGQTLWRDEQVRGSPFADNPHRLAWFMGSRLTAVDTRSGSVRWTVPLASDASMPRAFPYVLRVDDAHVLVIATTPPSNATQVRAIAQLIAIDTGAVTTRAEHDLFITTVRRVGDTIVLIGARGPTHPGVVIGYRLAR